MAMKLCRIVTWIFAVTYFLALVIFAIGTFGLFEQERDPLSAVFLIPIGLPWNQFIDGFSESIRPWLAAAVPLLNLAIIRGICAIILRSRN